MFLGILRKEGELRMRLVYLHTLIVGDHMTILVAYMMSNVPHHNIHYISV